MLTFTETLLTVLQENNDTEIRVKEKNRIFESLFVVFSTCIAALFGKFAIVAYIR